MVRRFRAHIDGRVFVPDEPMNLPKDQPVEVAVEEAAGENGTPDRAKIEKSLKALREFSGLFSAPPPSAESLRRENLYD